MSKKRRYRQIPILQVYDTMLSGNYRGETLEDIIQRDPYYVKNNIGRTFDLSVDAELLLEITFSNLSEEEDKDALDDDY